MTTSNPDLSTDEDSVAPLPSLGPLKPVPGPSPLGGGLKRAAELLYVMGMIDFKKVYFGTALGYVWSLARPLLLFAVLLIVFTQIFRIGSEVPYYPVLLLFNIVLFSFFQEATMMAVSSIVGQEAIVRKTQFPRHVIPISTVFTSLLNLGLNLVVVFIFIIAFGVSPTWSWFLFPVVLLLLIVITCAVAMIVSALYPRFRDLGIIWSVASTVLFYGTPVLYPINVVPETLRQVLMLNPLSSIFEEARRYVIDPSAPSAVSAAGGWLALVPALLIYVGTCVLAVWVFRREAPRIAEQL